MSWMTRYTHPRATVRPDDGPGPVSSAIRHTLRDLVVGDDRAITRIMSGGCAPIVENLDQRTVSLLRLAALIAADGDATSYQREIAAALAGGATTDDIVGVLVAVGSITGSSRLVAAAGKVALPIGYDVEADLEALPDEVTDATSRT